MAGSSSRNCLSLYVGALDARVDESLLNQVFSAYGDVVGVKIIADKFPTPSTFTHLKYGFVEYSLRADAEAALAAMSGHRIFDSAIVVNWAHGGTLTHRNRDQPPPLVNVWVGDLPHDMDDQNLSSIFRHFASFAEARVMWDHVINRSRGYGFVGFNSVEDAQLAIATMNGLVLDSDEHAPPPERPSTDQNDDSVGAELTDGSMKNNRNGGVDGVHEAIYGTQPHSDAQIKSDEFHSRDGALAADATPEKSSMEHAPGGELPRFLKRLRVNWAHQKVQQLFPSSPTSASSSGLPTHFHHLLNTQTHSSFHPTSHLALSYDQQTPYEPPPHPFDSSALNTPPVTFNHHAQASSSSDLAVTPSTSHDPLNFTKPPPHQHQFHPPPVIPSHPTLDFSAVASQSSPYNCSVYVGNLRSSVTADDLLPLFHSFGYVLELKMRLDRGYAFVKMNSHETAALAISHLHGVSIQGQQVKFSWSRDRHVETRVYLNTLSPQSHLMFYPPPHSSQQPAHSYANFDEKAGVSSLYGAPPRDQPPPSSTAAPMAAATNPSFSTHLSPNPVVVEARKLLTEYSNGLAAESSLESTFLIDNLSIHDLLIDKSSPDTSTLPKSSLFQPHHANPHTGMAASKGS